MIGTSQRFHYPDFGTPEGYPELRAHSGQLVDVVQREGEDSFLVRAADGAEFIALEEELGEPQFRPHDPAFCGCDA